MAHSDEIFQGWDSTFFLGFSPSRILPIELESENNFNELFSPKKKIEHGEGVRKFLGIWAHEDTESEEENEKEDSDLQSSSQVSRIKCSGYGRRIIAPHLIGDELQYIYCDSHQEQEQEQEQDQNPHNTKPDDLKDTNCKGDFPKRLKLTKDEPIVTFPIKSTLDTSVTTNHAQPVSNVAQANAAPNTQNLSKNHISQYKLQDRNAALSAPKLKTEMQSQTTNALSGPSTESLTFPVAPVSLYSLHNPIEPNQMHKAIQDHKNDCVQQVLNIMHLFDMKQKDVASEAGISPGAFSQWLSRKYKSIHNSIIEDRMKQWVNIRRITGPPDPDKPLVMGPLPKKRPIKKQIDCPIVDNTDTSLKRENRELREVINSLTSRLWKSEMELSSLRTELECKTGQIKDLMGLHHQYLSSIERMEATILKFSIQEKDSIQEITKPFS